MRLKCAACMWDTWMNECKVICQVRRNELWQQKLGMWKCSMAQSKHGKWPQNWGCYSGRKCQHSHFTKQLCKQDTYVQAQNTDKRKKQVAAVANNWEPKCQINLSKSSYWFKLKIWFMDVHIKASWFLNIETWCSKTTSTVTLMVWLATRCQSYLSVLHPHPSAWVVPSLKSKF